MKPEVKPEVKAEDSEAVKKVTVKIEKGDDAQAMQDEGASEEVKDVGKAVKKGGIGDLI